MVDARNEAWRKASEMTNQIMQNEHHRDVYLNTYIPDVKGRIEYLASVDPSYVTEEVADGLNDRIGVFRGPNDNKYKEYKKIEIGMNSLKPNPDPVGIVLKRALTRVYQDAINYMHALAVEYDDEIERLEEERQKLDEPYYLLPTNQSTNERRDGPGGRLDGMQGMGIPDHMRRGEMWQAGVNRRRR